MNQSNANQGTSTAPAHVSKISNDDRSNRTPWQCKKYACALQQCIAKNSSYRPDPVQYCRDPYYISYQQCINHLDEQEKEQKQ